MVILLCKDLNERLAMLNFNLKKESFISPKRTKFNVFIVFGIGLVPV